MSRVSVVIPVFNRDYLLLRALDSVLKQSFRDFEILVVDDHSTFDIPAVLKSLPVQYLKTQGKGVSAARNTGIRHSGAEMIAFLDSDDEWQSTKLEKQVAYLDSHPELSLVHTNEIWLRHSETVVQTQKHQKFGGRIFDKCTELCLIAPSSVLVRKKLFEDVGLFDEQFPVCEDFDLWLRITSREEIGFLSEALTIKHGGHSDQLSVAHHSMDLWRVRALAKHRDNKNLSSAEKDAIQRSLQKKVAILQKGFVKHQNFQWSKEVESYLL